MGLTKSIIPAAKGKSQGKASVLDQTTIEVPPTSAEERNGEGRPAEGAAVPARVDEARPSPQEIETLYLDHRKLLLFIACRKFRVPECDAENLIQEVFLSYLQVGTPIRDVRSWLVAAMCNASRHYWRAQGRTESLPDDIGERSDPGSHTIADTFAMKMTMWQALQYLQPRCRETIYLHYFEGRSAIDVARELETTSRYAEKLIHNCLKRVRQIYFDITAVKK